MNNWKIIGKKNLRFLFGYEIIAILQEREMNNVCRMRIEDSLAR